MSSGTLQLADFGLKPIDPFALTPGKDVVENAVILREAVSDIRSLRAQAILPSAAAAIWISGLEPNLPDAVDRAKSAIETGLAISKLNELVQAGASK